MKTIKLLFVLLCCSLLNIQGRAQEKQLVTFDEAMQIMLQQNPGLLRAKQEVKQKEFELKARKGLYYPQVAINAQAVSMSDQLHLDLTPVRDAIAPIYSTLGTYGVFKGVPNPDPNTNTVMPFLPDEMSTGIVRDKMLEAGKAVEAAEWDKVLQKKNFASVAAGVLWPIYTGGKIKGANDAARVNVKVSEEKVRQAQGALLSELVTRYYGLSLGMQVIEVRKQMLESMEKHYTDAEKLFEHGMIAKVELLHAKVSRNEAERELKQAQRNVEAVRAGLVATLASDSLKNMLPASHLFMNKEIENLNHWVTTARINNPQLKQLEGKKELVHIKSAVEKKEYLPNVAMMGTYNLADKDLSPYMPDWLVGVGMKWTLFKGMQRKNDIRAGETIEEQVAFAEQKAHNDIEAYLIKLYQEMQMQMEQKSELETTLELASEYSRSTEKAFNEGLATSTSVVEALSKVAQVKALRLKVMYDYDVLLARLLQTVGMPEKYTQYSKGENVISESL